MSEVWNNVTIYGPSAEIERFKREALAPEEEIYRDGQSGWDGCECTISIPPLDGEGRESEFGEIVRNFQQFTSDVKVEYSFSFDTYGGFPIDLFERLALSFPRLAFDCSCIESMDEFLGFGWFNAPPGGEEFSEDYRVPKNYWTGGGGRKRTETAEAEHQARIEKLIHAAMRTECTG